MIICRTCGAENPDGAKFCHRCGTDLHSQEPQPPKQNQAGPSAPAPKSPEAKTERNDTVCPFCQATDCQPMQKSTTEIQNKGYHWGQGCCGMFLLGPFGLLCGLCGTGTKIKSENALWWTCLKCGKQHIALADARKKWQTLMDGLPITGLSLGISAIILKILLRWLFGDGFFASAIVLVAPIIFSIYLLATGISEAEKELSAQLGESITEYLSQEEKNDAFLKQGIAIGIALLISLFGIPLLNLVLGD